MASDLPDHFCPGCGAAQRPRARYPWYFCQTCLKSAQDSHGRRVEFSNASLSGGLVWRLAGSSNVQEATQVICLIRARPALISEARFGGVVAQPLLAEPLQKRHASTHDLRQG